MEVEKYSVYNVLVINIQNGLFVHTKYGGKSTLTFKKSHISPLKFPSLLVPSLAFIHPLSCTPMHAIQSFILDMLLSSQ